MGDYNFEAEFDVVIDFDFVEELEVLEQLERYAPIILRVARTGLKHEGVEDPLPSQVKEYIDRRARQSA